MIPERDYFLAKAEVQARRAAADAERLARNARREAARSASAATPAGTAQPDAHGPLAWLRRLAGAR